MAGENPCAMQIHGRSAFSKCVAPWAGTRVLHSSFKGYTAASGWHEIPGLACSFVPTLLPLTRVPVLLSPRLCYSCFFDGSRRGVRSSTHGGRWDTRKKDVVAQLFSHDSDRPARLRPLTERSVAFVCDPRYAAKPNSRGRGPVRATMRRDAGDGTVL